MSTHITVTFDSYNNGWHRGRTIDLECEFDTPMSDVLQRVIDKTQSDQVAIQVAIRKIEFKIKWSKK